MRKTTFKYIESQLYYHAENKKIIEDMENNIIFAKGGDDENVGGGRSNIKSSTIENIVIKMNTNKKLYNMRKTVEAIDNVLEHVSDPYKKLIHMKYFSKKKYTWNGICDSLHISRATGFRMRKMVIEEIAERLGLI